MVILSIITILTALLVPALSRVKEITDEKTCLNNLRNIGAATMMFTMDNENYMPLASTNSKYPQKALANMSWRIEIAPYLGLKLANEFDMQLCEGVFQCPSFDQPGTIMQFGGYGWNQRFGYMENNYWFPRIRLTDVTEPSVSLYSGDSADWWKSGLYDFMYLRYPSWKWMIPPVGNRHNDGINLIWADGHASWMSQSDLMLGDEGKINYYYYSKR